MWFFSCAEGFWECAEMSIRGMGIFIVCVREVSFMRQPLTTGRHSRGLSKYVKFSFCERGKFYCEINFFFCE